MGHPPCKLWLWSGAKLRDRICVLQWQIFRLPEVFRGQQTSSHGLDARNRTDVVGIHHVGF